MVKKRLSGKVSEASKAVVSVKPRMSDVDLGRRVLASVNKTDISRKMQLAIKSVGSGIGRKSKESKSEIAAVADVLHHVVDNVSFADLSSALQDKFRAAGLGGDRGYRTASEAQSFYDVSVPDSVKLMGEEAVKKFLADKDASHIKSVANSPELANTNSNIGWENSAVNRARGAEDMSRIEQIQMNLNNGFDSFMITAGEIVPQAVLYAAVIEGAISIAENSIYVYRGNKDIATALQDTTRNVAKSAVVGLVIGTGVAGASALGAAPVIATAAPVLGVVGGGLLIYSASKRIHTALTTPVYEQGMVIDSCVRYLSDDDLLVPLDNELELLNAVRDEILATAPEDVLKRLPASAEVGVE